MRTIDYFDKQARLTPTKPLLVFGDERTSYGEMHALTHRLAGAMLDAGLQHQEAVAIMSPNHGGVVTAMLGLWRAGSVWIPVNTRQRAGRQHRLPQLRPRRVAVLPLRLRRRTRIP